MSRNIQSLRFARWLLKKMTGYNRDHSLLGDSEETYTRMASKSGTFKAKLWFWKNVLITVPAYCHFTLYWGVIMFSNYMKTAMRNIQRQKAFAFINSISLAVGIACFIFIYIFVSFETSYDTYHKDYKQLYRIAKSQTSKSGEDKFASVSTMMAPTVKEKFAQVENATRIWSNRDNIVRYGNKAFKEDANNLRYVDSEIFEIFYMPLLQGNPETALEYPFTAVLPERMAEKYFGDENPVGKTIKVDTVSFEVTGVYKTPPANSHVKFGILMSWKTIRNEEHLNGWNFGNVPTYIRLAKGVNPDEFAHEITKFAIENKKEWLEKTEVEYYNFLQPIADIHFHSNLIWEPGTPGNPMNVYVFSMVGVLILLIAGMNFVNLTTARSANRAKEVGIRKTIGAGKNQLVMQFLGESVVISFISFVCALTLVVLAMPIFNQFTGINFAITDLFQFDFAALFFGLMALFGLGAGSYPAFVLSAFKPNDVLRGTLSGRSKRSGMRTSLVIIQFSLSIILIVSTIVIYRQVMFMKDRDLGFDIEQKLIVNMQGNRVSPSNFEIVKKEFSDLSVVHGVTFSSSIPGRWRYLWRQWPTGEETTNMHAINCMQVDHDFFDEYGLEVIAGRTFQEVMSTDEIQRGYILNETAVKTFGWDSHEKALEQSLGMWKTPILGIMKDYHFEGLQNTIGPLGIFIMGEDYRYLTLKADVTNLEESISAVETKYKELFPEAVFDYFFLDQDFEQQYNSEEKLGKLFGAFTFFGLFIAGIGLFGLASFITELRAKEIGIRKALGSTTPAAIILLTKEFVKWVCFAALIGIPAAYFIAEQWLENFAYHIEVGLSIFIYSTLLSILLAIITVGYQSFKAASANPVDSLRSE